MNRTAISLLLVLTLLLGGCAPQGEDTGYQRYEKSFYNLADPTDSWFNTEISLVAYAESREDFDRYCEEVGEEFSRLHQLYNIYAEYEGVNNLATVNRRAHLGPVAVEDEMIDLLHLAQKCWSQTGGAVDVTLGPVLEIWHSYRDLAEGNPAGASVPSYEELSDAAQYADISGLIIDNEAKTVAFAREGMRLDVGALAKGYAAQKAMDRAAEAGMVSGILDAGGNIVVFGKPLDGREHWTVAIQDPVLSETGERRAFDVLEVEGPVSVVTSGDYQRYYTVGDITYHHIIDPATLFPAANCRAVTVIHADSATADMLSTAAYILPFQQARELVEELGAEAVWILEDGGVLQTEGYAALSQNR